MEIEVYDTYATSEKGIKIHFDVMLPIGGNEGNLQEFGRMWRVSDCEEVVGVEIRKLKL